jgi:recombination protein RecT
VSTVSTAVARRSQAETLIEQYTGDFAQVMPEHIKPATFVRLSQGLLRRDDKLAEAAAKNPGSFLAALLDCARLGHEPGTDAYALVPFGSEVQGIEQYQGEIERMYRAGAVSAVKAEVVRVNDYYEFDQATMQRPDHRPGWYCTEPPGQNRHARFLSEKDRGDLVGVYAYGEFPGGAVSRVVEMGKAEIDKHKAEAKGTSRSDSPWVKWEKSMWLKTAVHELEKWVPTSAEYRREQLRAAVEADNLRRPRTSAAAPPPIPEPTDITDAEIVDADTAEHATA